MHGFAEIVIASGFLALGCANQSEPKIGASDAPFDETGRSEEAPTGGAGYDFGITPDAARATCSASKAEWKHAAGATTCTKKISEAGATQLTILEFCSGKLCRIHTLLVLDRPDAKTWLTAYEGLRRELEKRYGAPDDSQVKLPAECEQVFSSCVKSGVAAARLRWFWEDGHAVMLLLGATGDAAAGIAVSYANPDGNPGDHAGSSRPAK